MTPAEYRTVTHKRVASEGSVSEWHRVVCERDLTSGKIRDIQLALKDKGYDPGPIDNVFGTQTKDALKRFQADKNLPQDNLDYETLKALGIQQ